MSSKKLRSGPARSPQGRIGVWAGLRGVRCREGGLRGAWGVGVAPRRGEGTRPVGLRGLGRRDALRAGRRAPDAGRMPANAAEPVERRELASNGSGTPGPRLADAASAAEPPGVRKHALCCTADQRIPSDGVQHNGCLSDPRTRKNPAGLCRPSTGRGRGEAECERARAGPGGALAGTSPAKGGVPAGRAGPARAKRLLLKCPSRGRRPLEAEPGKARAARDSASSSCRRWSE